MSYPIKYLNKDFIVIKRSSQKGSRVKWEAKTLATNEDVMMKQERTDYVTSEACSEKMSYEIALVLGYDVAKIELACGPENSFGVLNYIFKGIRDEFEHQDAIDYLNPESNIPRREFYTLDKIKITLDSIDNKLFFETFKIFIFDALVGETDRHEENWGIQKGNGIYKISPLYDNGCNLLREFKNEEFLKKFRNKEMIFIDYIKKSPYTIYKENGKVWKHFDLIKHLKEIYPDQIDIELENLSKLTNDLIIKIVNDVPKDLLTDEHKGYIIDYLIQRRDILLEMI